MRYRREGRGTLDRTHAPRMVPDHVAKSPADGHTLLMGAIGGLAVAMSRVPNRGYDTLRDLEPITQAVNVTNFLVVPSASSIRSLQDLLTSARARPGVLTDASTGNGTAPYLAGELARTEIVKWGKLVKDAGLQVQ
ncbi:MAG: tripartite tricarboxylate transporter substrate-binding protein [Burkholderiales bacterium]